MHDSKELQIAYEVEVFPYTSQEYEEDFSSEGVHSAQLCLSEFLKRFTFSMELNCNALLIYDYIGDRCRI